MWCTNPTTIISDQEEMIGQRNDNKFTSKELLTKANYYDKRLSRQYQSIHQSQK